MSLRRAATVLLVAVLGLHGPAGAASAAGTDPPSTTGPEVRTLENGLRVAFFQDHSLPIAEVVVLVPAGTAVADTEAGALAWPTAELLSHGTTSRDAQTFARAIEALGATFTSQATREHAVVAATFLAGDFDHGIELVSDAVQRPAFTSSEVDRVRRQAAVSAAHLTQNPAAQVEQRLWAEAFPGHPYARPAFPELPALRGLTADQVRAFYQRHYDPARSILAIGGDVSADRAFAAAKGWFGSWTRGTSTDTATVHAAPVPGGGRPRFVLVDRPGWSRAELRVGYRLPARGDAGAPAAALAASVLADGSDARLGALDRGGTFAGGVRVSRAELGAAGFISIGGNVPADSVGWAITRLREAVAGLSAHDPGPTEMETARRLETYAGRLENETLRGRMTRWCIGALQGLPADFEDARQAGLDRAGASDVVVAARRWFDPTHADIAVVGPAEQLAADLEKLGDVQAFTADGSEFPRGLLPAPEPPTAEAIAHGRELVRQAIAAHGGLDKLRGIKDSSVEYDVTLYVLGREVSGRMSQVRKEPYRMHFTTWIGGIETRQTLDGNRGWGVNTVGDQSASDLDAAQVAALRDAFESDVPHVLLALAADSVVVPVGRERIDDRDADAIALRNPNGERWVAYLDPASHRLLGLDQRDPLATPGSISRRVYSDYHAVDGIQLPNVETRFRGGQILMRMKVTKVTLNAGLGDAEFEKPVPLAPAPPR